MSNRENSFVNQIRAEIYFDDRNLLYKALLAMWQQALGRKQIKTLSFWSADFGTRMKSMELVET